MNTVAAMLGILLAFSSMWFGWYILRVWPELYALKAKQDEDMKNKDK